MSPQDARSHLILCHISTQPRLLGASRLGVHTNLGSSALHVSRILGGTCIPLTLHYGPHCSSYRDIAISQPCDTRILILRPSLARSRNTIPHSDPTVLLCYGSNDYPSLATSRSHDLEYPMLDSQLARPEFARSLDLSPPVLLRCTTTISSLLRHLASSRLATLHTQYLDFYPANSRVHEIMDLCHLSFPDGRL
jgi:hypothetical protein